MGKCAKKSRIRNGRNRTKRVIFAETAAAAAFLLLLQQKWPKSGHGGVKKWPLKPKDRISGAIAPVTFKKMKKMKNEKTKKHKKTWLELLGKMDKKWQKMQKVQKCPIDPFFNHLRSRKSGKNWLFLMLFFMLFQFHDFLCGSWA